jgi:hypothetical protein
VISLNGSQTVSGTPGIDRSLGLTVSPPVGRDCKTPSPTAETEKRCPGCSATKPTSAYGKNKARRDGLQVRCRECRKSTRIRVLVPYPVALAPVDRRREDKLRGYGLNLVAYYFLLDQQGGRCAICRTDKPGAASWCVDHDHACCPTRKRCCGRCVRGLLCINCNLALGLMSDDIDRLKAAISYLTKG